MCFLNFWDIHGFPMFSLNKVSLYQIFTCFPPLSFQGVKEIHACEMNDALCAVAKEANGLATMVDRTGLNVS